MITGIGSYFVTTQEFAANWNSGNGELAPGSLILAGQYTQAMFVTDRTALLALIDDTSIQATAARDAAGLRDTLKNNLMLRGKQFRGVVSGQIAEDQILKDLPTLPKIGDVASTFLDPFKAMNRLWGRINANFAGLGLAGPLVLEGGFDQDQFVSMVEDSQIAYESAANVEELLSDARGARDNAMKAIYERMKQYRALAPGILPANSPALANLPRLSPEAGTTPPGLVVTGFYDAVTGEAVFNFPASTAKNILKLQARGCTGTVYKGDEEEVIGDLLPTATEFRTNWGLEAPGAKIAVKIYVMLTTGNENGGKVVKIVRPVT